MDQIILNLKKVRENKGYTQEYMAKQLGYKTKSAYNHIEQGKVKLDIDKLIKIAEILEVEPSIFLVK